MKMTGRVPVFEASCFSSFWKFWTLVSIPFGRTDDMALIMIQMSRSRKGKEANLPCNSGSHSSGLKNIFGKAYCCFSVSDTTERFYQFRQLARSSIESHLLSCVFSHRISIHLTCATKSQRPQVYSEHKATLPCYELHYREVNPTGERRQN
eukprot:scaffold619_cov150-Skeletonema_menzelii.AAC.3